MITKPNSLSGLPAQPLSGARFSSTGRAISACALPFLSSRVLVLITAFFLQYLLDSGHAVRYDYIGHAPLATLSAIFDANWYVSIAESGYSTSPDVTQQQNYHFFPLYPFMVYLGGKLSTLHQVQGGYALTGVILSHLFFFAALVLLYRLTVSLANEEGLARRVVWLTCALPWAFVFSMTYTESLFLLLSVGAASAAYKAAERPMLVFVLLASLISIAAALTRPQGLVVSLLAAALIATRSRTLSTGMRVGYGLLVTAPAVVAVASFIMYTGWRTGNTWAVLQDNNAWGSGWLFDLPRLLTLPPANPVWFVDVYSTFGLIAWLFLLVLLSKEVLNSGGMSMGTGNRATNQNSTKPRGLWPFVAYSWVYFLFTALNSSSNTSWGRYLMVIFPCIWALSSVLVNSTRFRRLIVVSLMLQTLFFSAAILQQATP